MKRTEFHHILSRVLNAGVEVVTVVNNREDPRYPGEFIKGPDGTPRRFQSVLLRLRSTLDGAVLAERDLEVESAQAHEIARAQVDFVMEYIERNDISISDPDPVDPVALELAETKSQVAEMAAQIALLTRAIAPKAGAAE